MMDRPAELARHGERRDEPPADAPLASADRVQAALVALVAFGVYLATMYPGLHEVGDAAKFAFVGKLLGTPHAPGYPLYVVVSHLFSYVPWGTLAYRMNALSAVFGAMTVGLGYLIVRRLGAGRMAAVATSLALGFGSAFWSRSLYAKGYTLNAAIVSAGVLALLRWERTRRPRDLYWAAGLFALGLGNHLIIIAMLPAVVLFVVITDPRSSLRPKTMAIVLLIGALGLAQYGFIILRTRQAALYLEARASNLSELWQVMTARRFSHEIGAFPVATLMADRVPHVARLVYEEIGPVGIPLLIVGFVVLVARRPRRAVLFGLGALGVAALTVNMSSNEDEGFLLPVFVLLWPVVGFGLERLAAGLPRVPRRAAAGAALAVVVVLPCRQVVANYRVNDRHAETADIEYFDALFAALPEKAAFVDDEYRVDMMVTYKLLGERAAGGRDIRLIKQDRNQVRAFRRDGFDVLAFEAGRSGLSSLGFRFAPFEGQVTQETRDILRRRPIYRLLDEAVCFDAGNRGWMDIGASLWPKGRVSLKIDNYHPFDSRVTIYAGMEAPRSPSLVGEGGAFAPSVDVEVFPRDDPGARKRLDARLVADGARLPDGMLEAPFVERLLLRVNDKGAFFAAGLDFGGTLTGALAQALVDRDNPERARFCTHPLADVDAWPAGVPGLGIPLDAVNVEFAEGWYSLERRSDGLLYRWTSDRSTLVLPLEHPRRARMTLYAEPLNYDGRPEGAIALVVNGQRIGSHPLPAGAGRFSWEVEAALWRVGLNNVTLDVTGARRPSEAGRSSDTRLLGVSVTRVELTALGGD